MELSFTNQSRFANQQGLGERQLCRCFKEATGETPLSYLQKYRVEQVKLGWNPAKLTSTI
jgi:transcriptional regulator GlxA family with amidase domain